MRAQYSLEFLVLLAASAAALALIAPVAHDAMLSGRDYARFSEAHASAFALAKAANQMRYLANGSSVSLNLSFPNATLRVEERALVLSTAFSNASFPLRVALTLNESTVDGIYAVRVERKEESVRVSFVRA